MKHIRMLAVLRVNPASIFTVLTQDTNKNVHTFSSLSRLFKSLSFTSSSLNLINFASSGSGISSFLSTNSLHASHTSTNRGTSFGFLAFALPSSLTCNNNVNRLTSLHYERKILFAKLTNTVLCLYNQFHSTAGIK
jgi:hypothetical protein